MADGNDESVDEKIRRSVARTVASGTLLLVSLGVLGGWAYTAWYVLDPGEAAVVLRFGAYNRTVTAPGFKFRLPEPLESHRVVNVTKIREVSFGLGRSGRQVEPGAETATFMGWSGSRVASA